MYKNINIHCFIVRVTIHKFINLKTIYVVNNCDFCILSMVSIEMN